MNKRKLIWHIFPAYLAILVVSLTAVSWLSFNFSNRFYMDRTSAELESKAEMLLHLFSPLIFSGQASSIDTLCKSVGKSSKTRVTVIQLDGQVIGDSDETPSEMDSHATREEILSAKAHGVGRSVRYSKTLEKPMMYVAIVLRDADDRPAGFLRTAMPVTSLSAAVRKIRIKLAATTVFLALILAGISLLVARRISHPIREITLLAKRFAQGDLSQKPGVYDTEELADLAQAMNAMAAELNSRINTIIGQRNELETVLSSMLEGVIAVDMDDNIIKVNASAAAMLDIDVEKCRGKSIQEIIRNAAFQKFIARVSQENAFSEEDIVIYNEEERILNIHGSPIFDAKNHKIGTLIVIDDVTRLRRLENVRRDFVANVSHEIRTPLTAIKGFVETLLQDLDRDPEKSMQFLTIILKHVDRLSALVEDLLSLSKIENLEQDKIRMTDECVLDVIQTAVNLCQAKADKKQIAINVEGDASTAVRMDKTLLEQAVVNILDNAINYSERGSTVDIRVSRDNQDDFLMVAVTDRGIGIPKEHLSRLFERFYRVDRARSRKMGGTGLGLSIVKHIVATHGGTVGAQSTPGKGSTFTLRLPMKKSVG
jgi:two-component system, OmpR family, phosphate regulon sensor histidine kinase PhoR